MSVQAVAGDLLADDFIGEFSAPWAVPHDRDAVAGLLSAYDERRPLTLLVGDGKSSRKAVIDHFRVAVIDNPTMIRTAGAAVDAEDFLREVIHDLGFSTKDLGKRDLVGILELFLAFQKKHGRRTILCVEDASECVYDVLDELLRLVDLECVDAFGLFIVLTGPRALEDRLDRDAFRAVMKYAGQPVRIARATVAETRALVARHLRSVYGDTAGHAIEGGAVDRLHRVTGGNWDAIYGMCDKSVELATELSAWPISENTVVEAANELGLLSDHREDEALSIDSSEEPTGRFGALRIQDQEKRPYRFLLDKDVVTIGRDKSSDVHLPSLMISRQHAVLYSGPYGVRIVDLHSTNGTHVNGQKVMSHTLSHGDRVVVGNFAIEFVAETGRLDEIVASEILALAR